MTNKILISQEQDIRDSSVYAGYLVLKELKNEERISIFDLYDVLKGNGRQFNYSNSMYALIFLYMNGLIDFDEPYIYRLK
jgi:hypothetical protein